MHASKLWIENLRLSGYEHHCDSIEDLGRIKKLVQFWRPVFSRTEMKPPAKMFELGCGGGRHMAALALNGFHVHGIDVSSEVLVRCKTYFDEIKRFSDKPVNATCEEADILNYNMTNQYDLAYHIGVVEHFSDREERMAIWSKLYNAIKTGGWLLSVVPNGSHLWRKYIKENGLCGYNVPEIDYGVKNHKEEFLEIGLRDVVAIPWNYFGFAQGMVKRKISKVVAKAIFLSSNVLIPLCPCADTIKEKFAHALIVLGRK